MSRFCLCGKIVEQNAKCGCDRQKQRQAHKASTKDRGYGNDWRRLSENYRREHPLCERCVEKDRTTPARHVHHRIPIKDAPTLRLERANLMAVCVACHVEMEGGSE